MKNNKDQKVAFPSKNAVAVAIFVAVVVAVIVAVFVYVTVVVTVVVEVVFFVVVIFLAPSSSFYRRRSVFLVPSSSFRLPHYVSSLLVFRRPFPFAFHLPIRLSSTYFPPDFARFSPVFGSSDAVIRRWKSC